VFGRYMNVFIKKTPPYKGEGDNVLKAIGGSGGGLDNMAQHADARRHDVFGPAS